MFRGEQENSSSVHKVTHDVQTDEERNRLDKLSSSIGVIDAGTSDTTIDLQKLQPAYKDKRPGCLRILFPF